MFTVRRWLSAAATGGGGAAARGGSAAARGGRVPRIGELRTAREVLQVHERHALQMRPVDVSSCWSTLGKLIRQHREECEWMKAELRRSKALAPLLDSMLQKLPLFEPRSVATAVYGLASVVSATRFAPDKRVWKALEARSADVSTEFNPQELANTAYAFVKAKHPAPALLDAIAAEAAPRVRDFNAQDLANTAWAYATAQHAAPALLDAIAAEAAPRVRDFKPQELANTAWAYAAADHCSCEVLFGRPVFVAHCDATQAAFLPEDLCQLHQWQLWLEERGAAWPRLPLPLAERCHAAFVAVKGRPSRLQRQVVAALKALGHEPREEVRTPQGYSLDAVVRIASREVAIEVDGPSHFVGRTHAPTGATALKRRQLRAAGWSLVPVPYWQWGALDATGQRELLLRELRNATEPKEPKAETDPRVTKKVRELLHKWGLDESSLESCKPTAYNGAKFGLGDIAHLEPVKTKKTKAAPKAADVRDGARSAELLDSSSSSGSAEDGMDNDRMKKRLLPAPDGEDCEKQYASVESFRPCPRI